MDIDQRIERFVELHAKSIEAATAKGIGHQDSALRNFHVGMEAAILEATNAEAAMLRAVAMERVAVASALSAGIECE